MGVKEPKQRVAKGPLAEVVSAAKKLEETRKPGETRRIKEPAPAAGNFRGGEKRGSQERPGETRGMREPVHVAKNPRKGKKRGN